MLTTFDLSNGQLQSNKQIKIKQLAMQKIYKSENKRKYCIDRTKQRYPKAA